VKAKYIIGVAVIVGAAVFGALEFRGTMTPYVDFNEAKASQTRCQVMGEVEHGATSYESASQTLLFTIVDEMPGNFEQAESVVAKGHFDGRRFEADELLVKCPSKYQGGEV